MAEALTDALGQIRKQYGPGAIMLLQDQVYEPIEVIPTGSLALDLALGVGGLPRGRISEVIGPESVGKSTLALHLIANAQRLGGKAAFIDAEHAFDREYADKLGVDTNNLLMSQPGSGEEALDIALMLVRSSEVALVIVDSVAALVPKAELAGDAGDSHVGLQARLMSQAMRRMTGALSQSNTAALFTNQIREKIGVQFGPTETTPGGRALKFYASVRLDMRRIETLKMGDVPIGNRTRVKVIKNKVSSPFRTAEFDLRYGEGISHEVSLLDLGVDHGIVKKSGAWYSYEGDHIGQGKENARIFLQDNPGLAGDIETRIRENFFSKGQTPTS